MPRAIIRATKEAVIFPRSECFFGASVFDSHSSEIQECTLTFFKKPATRVDKEKKVTYAESISVVQLYMACNKFSMELSTGRVVLSILPVMPNSKKKETLKRLAGASTGQTLASKASTIIVRIGRHKDG